MKRKVEVPSTRLHTYSSEQTNNTALGLQSEIDASPRMREASEWVEAIQQHPLQCKYPLGPSGQGGVMQMHNFKYNDQKQNTEDYSYEDLKEILDTLIADPGAVVDLIGLAEALDKDLKTPEGPYLMSVEERQLLSAQANAGLRALGLALPHHGAKNQRAARPSSSKAASAASAALPKDAEEDEDDNLFGPRTGTTSVVAALSPAKADLKAIGAAPQNASVAATNSAPKVAASAGTVATATGGTGSSKKKKKKANAMAVAPLPAPPAVTVAATSQTNTASNSGQAVSKVKPADAKASNPNTVAVVPHPGLVIGTGAPSSSPAKTKKKGAGTPLSAPAKATSNSSSVSSGEADSEHSHLVKKAKGKEAGAGTGQVQVGGTAAAAAAVAAPPDPLIQAAIQNAEETQALIERLLGHKILNHESGNSGPAKENAARGTMSVAGRSYTAMSFSSRTGEIRAAMEEGAMNDAKNVHTNVPNHLANAATTFYAKNTITLKQNRSGDSEIKLLEYFIQMLIDQFGVANPGSLTLGERRGIRGEIIIHSDRTPCLSCGTLIDKFRRDYPGIRIVVTYKRVYKELGYDEPDIKQGGFLGWDLKDAGSQPNRELLSMDRDTDKEHNEAEFKKGQRMKEVNANRQKELDAQKAERNKVSKRDATIAKTQREEAAKKAIQTYKASLSKADQKIFLEKIENISGNWNNLVKDVAKAKSPAAEKAVCATALKAAKAK